MPIPIIISSALLKAKTKYMTANKTVHFRFVGFFSVLSSLKQIFQIISNNLDSLCKGAAVTSLDFASGFKKVF